MSKTLTSIPVLLVISLSILMVACSSGPKDKAGKQLHVSTIELNKTDVFNSINLSAKVQAVSDISTPFRLADYVDKVNFAEGDTVEKGDIVIELRSKAQQSALEQADISLENAKKDFDRAKRLRRSGTYSDAQLEKFSSGLKAAEAQYENAKSMASYSRLPSPISGVVNRIPAKVGAYVNVGSLAFQVVDVNDLEVEVWVPEKSINTVDVGSNATVIRSNDPSALPYKGKVSSISLTPDPITNTYRVLVDVSSTPQGMDGEVVPRQALLRPGNIVSVEIVTHTYEDIYAVPLTSVVLKGGTRSIYLTKDGDVKKMLPNILDTIGDVAVLGNEFPEGYRLIVRGQRFITGSTTAVFDSATQQAEDLMDLDTTETKGKGKSRGRMKGIK